MTKTRGRIKNRMNDYAEAVVRRSFIKSVLRNFAIIYEEIPVTKSFLKKLHVVYQLY